MLSKINESKRRPNRLISEKSPYLLQHAYNPVDWYPWGEEAFEKAKKEDKPILLSIGYSTCHWCHVMERESFEDEEVARLMNDAFVSIKVDREERPDIDGIYMKACQHMTGSGGWPLNMIITPDKKPFYAATYIPKESSSGRIGILNMIPRIKTLWSSQRDEVEKLADQSISALRDVSTSGKELGEDILHAAYEQLLEMFDEEYGGFGDAPKFPTPHNLMFLLRYCKRTGDKMALFIVEKTIKAMRSGGIYDHIGFGFHRYSVDSRWLVPHFEKMLYDQALLSFACIEAYQATWNAEYEKTCREIFTYVLRGMTAPEGGFYSGEDADSEGEEGKFYLWTEEGIRSVLPEHDAELVKRIFNINKEGNFPEGKSTGRNIFYLTKSINERASALRLPVEELKKRIEMTRHKLFNVREKRIHPGKDDKILTDWNGLMIAAFAKGAQVFDDPEYANAAQHACDFILSKMTIEGKLYHRYRDGEVAVNAFLDDYAFLIWGLIELYETTFELRYLQTALELNNHMLIHFWDEKNGGLYFTADDAENILIRKKELYDGAVPSGNSVAMLNLIRLGKLTANPEFEKKAQAISRTFSQNISQAPVAYTMLMAALDFGVGPSSEVVIAGDLQAEDTKNMLAALRKEFIPDKVVIFLPREEEPPEIIHLAGYTKNMSSIEGKATAYVCKNYTCKLPTTDARKMLEMIKS